MKTLAALSVSVILGAWCAAAQPAEDASPQAPPPASAPSSGTSSSAAPPKPKMDRRITGGVSLTVLGLPLVPSSSSNVTNSAAVSTQYSTGGASQRIGYGLTIQARITDHFYINVGGLLRRMGYDFLTTVQTQSTGVLNGVAFPITTSTSTHENTHARFLDFPALVRYYGTGKRPGTLRWFVEAGGTYRTVNSVRTSIDTTDASGNLSCCTFTPATPQHKTTVGITAGAGLQMIDDFGIHLIPEVRYTRWMDSAYDNFTNHIQRNQVEVVLSLTF